MRKTQTLFVRDPNTRLVTPEVTPGCEWVLQGKGEPTRQWDGTCCMVSGGRLYRRCELKDGAPTPADWPTGSRVGWAPVLDGPEDQWHREAFAEGHDFYTYPFRDWTYELCGPKVQGNPERLELHHLFPHAFDVLWMVPLDFSGICEYLLERDIEGIVWWLDRKDADSPRAKIKRLDFGYKR